MNYLLLAVFAIVVVLVSSQDEVTEMVTVTDMTTSGMTTSGMTTSGMTTPGDETTWEVKNTNGSVCILAQLAANISVEYTTTSSTLKTVLGLSEEASVNNDLSSCGSETSPAVLVLSWGNNSLTHEFELTNGSYSVSKVEAVLLHDNAHFPGSKDENMTVTYSGEPTADLFKSSSAMSYRCNSPVMVQMNKTLWNVTYREVKIQPFGVKNDKFSDESVCSADTATTPMTTSFAPTTTVMPKPGEWTVEDGSGNVCMNITFSCKFSIKYIMTNMKENTTEPNLPQDASATTSTCNDTDATFTLTFFDGWMLSMKFHRKDNSTSSSYKVMNYTLTYFFDNKFTNPLLAGENVTVFNEKTGIEADNANYYLCKATVKVKADNTTSTFSEMELQPFAKDTDGSRGEKYTECAADSEISNIVPIAVGCALAGLVIIVLIAYLIGRSRSTRQGYQSV